MSGKYKVFLLQGGTWSGKTYSILQLIANIAEKSTKPRSIKLFAETYPKCRDGIMEDFFEIIGSSKNDPKYNGQSNQFLLGNCKIDFRNVDNPDSLKVKKFDIGFLNEGNCTSKDVYNQMEPRIKESLFIDWNPDVKFWAHDLIGKDGVWFDISTHFDNEFTPSSIRKTIEDRKETDPEWYRVYGQGQIGQYEGTIFKNLEIKDLNKEYQECDIIYHGIDFGYNPDPFAYVIVGMNKALDTIYIFKEVVENDVFAKDMYYMIKDWAGKSTIYCDSEDPQAIDELKSMGLMTEKVGSKDRQSSINWLRSKKIIIDTECKVAQKEFTEYHRNKDKHGEYLPEFPQNQSDHTISAVRYAFKERIGKIAKIKNIHIGGI